MPVFSQRTGRPEHKETLSPSLEPRLEVSSTIVRGFMIEDTTTAFALLVNADHLLRPTVHGY